MFRRGGPPCTAMVRAMASGVLGGTCSGTNGNGPGGTRSSRQTVSPGGKRRIISQGGCGSVQGQHVVMHGTRTQNSFAPNVEEIQDQGDPDRTR